MARLLVLALVFALSAASTGTARAQPGTMPAILTLDSARIGQERYLRLLLTRVYQAERADLFSSATGCLSRGVEEAEDCLRFENRSRPRPEPVLILDDALDGDRRKPGLALLVCVGGGIAASDPERQTIRLWPMAYGLHGVTPLIEDRVALERCIEAARQEPAP